MHRAVPVVGMCVGSLVATILAPAFANCGPAHFCNSCGVVLASMPMTHGQPDVVTTCSAVCINCTFRGEPPSECHMYSDAHTSPQGTICCTQATAKRPGDSAGDRSHWTPGRTAIDTPFGVANKTPAEYPPLSVVAAPAAPMSQPSFLPHCRRSCSLSFGC